METKKSIEAAPILILDTLELNNLFDIRRWGDRWLGEWHAITWEPMRSICVAQCALSAQVCSRPLAEFELQEFVYPVGNQARVGVGVAFVGRAALNEKLLATRDAAAAYFLELIGVRQNINNHVLGFCKDLTPEAQTAAVDCAKSFLEKHGGKKIPIAINAQLINSKTEIQLQNRLASKPVEQVPEEVKVIEGFIEGLDRPDRSCHIVRLDGGESLFVKFQVETDLARLLEVVCNDQCYAISLSDVLDAKGRSGTIITRVDALPDVEAQTGPLELQPSPQGSRRSLVPRRAKRH